MAGATYVADLKDGQVVDATFAVQTKRRRRTRSGDAFLSLELADRTGRVPGVLWTDVHVIDQRFAEGDTVRVLGRVGSYDGRLQMRAARPAAARAGGCARARAGSRRDAETLDGMIEFLAGEIHHEGLRELVATFLEDGAFRDRLRPPRPVRRTTPTPAACSSTPWRWPRSAARPGSSTRG